MTDPVAFNAGNKTVRLLWASERQPKQVIPQYALYPKGMASAGAGAGLNVTYFTTKTVGSTLEFDTATAAGATTDLSLTAPVGQLGIPDIQALASDTDTAAKKLPPPMIERPRYEDEISPANSQIPVQGTGVPGSSIDITILFASGVTTSVGSVAVGTNGAFNAQVPVTLPASGVQTVILGLVQRPSGIANCTVSTLCSYKLTWPVTVVLPTKPTRPLEITSPRDPTHRPDPQDNQIPVVGKGTSGLVTITEMGNNGATVTPTTLPASAVSADGTITGTITLSDGRTNPNLGWHKLLFSQASGVSASGVPAMSKPVFVSVGIRPPTVTYPRTGADLGCSEPKDGEPRIRLQGKLPYSEATFGPVLVLEETGGAALRPVPGPCPAGVACPPERFVATTPGVDGLFDFWVDLAPGPGKHLLHVFQAPPLPGATQAQLDAHYRMFAAIADTPTSRLVINERPPRFDIPGGAGPFYADGTNPPELSDLLPGVQFPAFPGGGPFTMTFTCPIGGAALCAQSYADVNPQDWFPCLHDSRFGYWFLDDDGRRVPTRMEPPHNLPGHGLEGRRHLERRLSLESHRCGGRQRRGLCHHSGEPHGGREFAVRRDCPLHRHGAVLRAGRGH